MASRRLEVTAGRYFSRKHLEDDQGMPSLPSVYLISLSMASLLYCFLNLDII